MLLLPAWPGGFWLSLTIWSAAIWLATVMPPYTTLPKTVNGPPLDVPSSEDELLPRLMNHWLVPELGPLLRAMAIVPVVLEVPDSLLTVPRVVMAVPSLLKPPP